MADADAMIDGFCGISQRRGLKPIIAAVNGYAFGMNRHRILNFLPNFPFPRLGSEMMSFLITRFISRRVLIVIGGGMEMVVNWYVLSRCLLGR